MTWLTFWAMQSLQLEDEKHSPKNFKLCLCHEVKNFASFVWSATISDFYSCVVVLYVQLVDCSEASRATHARTHSRTRSSSHRSFHCLAFSAANIFTTDNSVRFNWDRPGKQHRSQQPTQLISFAGKCRQKKNFDFRKRSCWMSLHPVTFVFQIILCYFALF